VASLRDLRIDKPDGTQVRLGDVADVRIRPNPVVIAHNEVSRNVEVVADVFGRDLGAVTSDVESRLQKITFPREHHVEVLKDSVNMQSGQQRTLLYAIAAAIAIFFLLQAIFGSWRLAGLLFFVSLAALSGGVLVAVFRQDVLSVTSLLGLLTVLALVVRSGILLIKQYQRLEQHGQTPGPDLVVRGAQERFGPILTTVFSTGLVLTPLVVLGNGAGLEMVGPMASIILGGLLSATLLVLFVLPTLYLGFGSRRSRNELHTSAQSATQGGRIMMPTRKSHRWTIAALAAASLVVPACTTSMAQTHTVAESPATVESIAGDGPKQVTLTPRAAERLGIKTTQPVVALSAQPTKVVPYSAVIYDVDGNTWVYTVPKPLSYLRYRVVIADIRGNQATVTKGPPPATVIVTEGASMLYGTELGVGKGK
jgi:hypothetical protein